MCQRTTSDPRDKNILLKHLVASAPLPIAVTITATTSASTSTTSAAPPFSLPSLISLFAALVSGASTSLGTPIPILPVITLTASFLLLCAFLAVTVTATVTATAAATVAAAPTAAITATAIRATSAAALTATAVRVTAAAVRVITAAAVGVTFQLTLSSHDSFGSIFQVNTKALTI